MKTNVFRNLHKNQKHVTWQSNPQQQ